MWKVRRQRPVNLKCHHLATWASVQVTENKQLSEACFAKYPLYLAPGSFQKGATRCCLMLDVFMCSDCCSSGLCTADAARPARCHDLATQGRCS